LTVLGLDQAEHFWPGLLQTLRIALPVAVAFGLGALFHNSLHERIRRLEKDLRAQEMAAEQNRKLAAESRLRSLEARIHPHFLFNTLNSISSLIALDPGRAERVVSRLAALLRGALDNSPRTTITLREELGLVESYLDIEHIRFGDKLRWSMSAAPDTLETHVPRMAVLSLAENSVKHGITARGGGAVDVVASIQGGDVHVEVRDTGPGFELEAIPAGHGLDSLAVRLEAQFGGRARLNVERREGCAVVEMVVPHS
jgi:LytS/YehU family sensor histidine kinase